VNLLALYLQDHLTLSLAGLRIARRCERENRDHALGAYLAVLVRELEEDRRVVREALRALGGTPSVLKELAAVAGELLGRLKLNGRLLTYSPLSRLWEVEALLAGTDSRRGLWKVLARMARREPRLTGFTFELLEERTLAQREALERHRLRAAEEAFGPRPALVPAGEAPAHAPR
jgi:hypothetical protein